MAITWPKKTLTVELPNDAMLATLPIYVVEGASQTFLAGSPLVFSSGYLVVATDAVTTAAAFAMEDGHNSAAGTDKVKIVPAMPGYAIHLYGNLLTTTAGDNVLAATDHGVKMQINYEAAGGSNGENIWHFGDTQSSEGVKVVEFRADAGSLPPNVSQIFPAAGDTNARVRAALLDSVADWAV